MKSLRFLALFILLSGNARALVCQVSGDPVEGNDPLADILAAGEKLNQGPLDEMKVAYQELRSSEPQHRIAWTEGLNPCIALLLKGTNQKGEPIVCLTHLNAPLPTTDRGPQTQAMHTEQIADFYDRCKRELVTKGLNPSSLRVLYHAAEPGTDSAYETSSKQQQNDINFRAFLNSRVAAGEIPEFRAVYKNTPEEVPRTFSYDIRRGTFRITYTSPELGTDPLLEGEF